jgi:hypothetical protein
MFSFYVTQHIKRKNGLVGGADGSLSNSDFQEPWDRYLINLKIKEGKPSKKLGRVHRQEGTGTQPHFIF